MNSQKKFLTFAVILNIVFFAGVSFWVQSQRTENPLAFGLAHGVQSFNKQFQSDVFDARTLFQELTKTTSLARKKEIVTAFTDDIEMAFEIYKTNILEIIGQRKSLPFPQVLFATDSIGFHRQKDLLFWTYFVNHSSLHATNDAVLTLKKPMRSLDKLLMFSGISLAIVEQDFDQQKILYSNLKDPEAQDLLAQAPFKDAGLAYNADATTIAQNEFYMTLQRQKYLAVMLNLSHTDTFKQKIIFVMKDADYEGLSLPQLHLMIWTLFCICVGLTALILKKSVDESVS